MAVTKIVQISEGFYGLSKFLIYPLQIIGYFPVEIHQDHKLSFRPTSLWSYYSAILLLGHIMCVFLQFYYQDVLNELLSITKTAAIFNMCSIWIVLTSSLWIRLWSLAHVESVATFFNDHVVHLEKLAVLNENLVCYDGKRYNLNFLAMQKQLKWLVLSITIAVAGLFFNFVKDFILIDTTAHKWLEGKLGDRSLMLYQVFIFLWLLFTSMNIFTIAWYLFFPKLYAGYLDSITEEIKKVNELQRLHSRLHFRYTWKNLVEAIDLIEGLIEQFNKLSWMNFLSLLSVAYIAIIATSFVLISAFAYESKAPLAVIATQLTGFSLQIAVILQCSSAVSQSASRLRDGIFRAKLVEETTSDQVTMVLLDFSLQPPAVCLANLLNIDIENSKATFLSILTYLLILVQFQLSEK